MSVTNARTGGPVGAFLRTLAAAVAIAQLAVLAGCASIVPAVDPLPSWNDTAPKRSIVAFVTNASTESSPGFIPVAQRIAVFDNDGTLWAEHPVYFQIQFAFDRVKALAPSHPEWKTTQPFEAVLEGDAKAVAASGERGMAQIMMATHSGMTTEEFADVASAWVASARHPRFDRPYTEMVYQPMVELLAYLRSRGFKTYIVSGGEGDFMRVFAEKVYGIPPEQVIGSTIVTRFEMKDGKPVLVREAKLDFVDDKAGKPVAINRFIGRRPVLAFGNSDGDQQMLEWTAAGAGPSFLGIVHHTDADREYAYDRQSSIGRLDKALDEAGARGWTVVDMKRDWKRVFAFQ
jgi:phosphoglycolate phosphatase-like HAD superfamily hydrolase